MECWVRQSTESQHTLQWLGIMDGLQTLSQRRHILSIEKLQGMHQNQSMAKNNPATNVDIGYAATV
jgi:hypothetical protein